MVAAPFRNHAPIPQIPSADALPPKDGFFSKIDLRYGPSDTIGRFLLRAGDLVRSAGLTLEFGSFEKLLECNTRNRHSWRPIVPVLDPTYNQLTEDNSFCIFGRDTDGNVVATQAARLIDLRGTDLRTEAESLRMFYGASPPNDYTILLNAPSASSISGLVAYSGGVWYHPRFRGRALSSVLPRMCRALAIATWDVDYALSFVEDALIEKNMPARYGYPRFERHFSVGDARFGDVLFSGALIWLSQAEALVDMRTQLTRLLPEVDRVPHLRRA